MYITTDKILEKAYVQTQIHTSVCKLTQSSLLVSQFIDFTIVSSLLNITRSNSVIWKMQNRIAEKLRELILKYPVDGNND